MCKEYFNLFNVAFHPLKVIYCTTPLTFFKKITMKFIFKALKKSLVREMHRNENSRDTRKNGSMIRESFE